MKSSTSSLSLFVVFTLVISGKLVYAEQIAAGADATNCSLSNKTSFASEDSKEFALGFTDNLTSIPAYVWDMKSLTSLEISTIKVGKDHRLIPTDIGRLAKLTRLEITNTNLSGPLPTQLGLLTGLQVMVLSHNCFQGRIPASFERLKSLRELYLDDNQFHAEFPPHLLELSNLTIVNLNKNQFYGPLPDFDQPVLPKLERLELENNMFNGSLPSNISRLSSLRRMNFGYNEFHGTIPTEFRRLRLLEEMFVNYNRLTGEEIIPWQMRNLKNLFHVKLGGNNFSPTCDCELLSWFPRFSQRVISDAFEINACSNVNSFGGIYPFLLIDSPESPCTHFDDVEYDSSHHDVNIVWNYSGSELSRKVVNYESFCKSSDYETKGLDGFDYCLYFEEFGYDADPKAPIHYDIANKTKNDVNLRERFENCGTFLSPYPEGSASGFEIRLRKKDAIEFEFRKCVWAADVEMQEYKFNYIIPWLSPATDYVVSIIPFKVYFWWTDSQWFTTNADSEENDAYEYENEPQEGNRRLLVERRTLQTRPGGSKTKAPKSTGKGRDKSKCKGRYCGGGREDDNRDDYEYEETPVPVQYPSTFPTQIAVPFPSTPPQTHGDLTANPTSAPSVPLGLSNRGIFGKLSDISKEYIGCNGVPNFIVESLQQNAQYQYGPRRDTEIRTKDYKPSEPRNLRALTASSRSIMLTWDTPLNTNGKIKTYRIRYFQNGNQKEVNTTIVAEPFQIENLESNTAYEFVVNAFTEAGYGDSVSITVSTCLENMNRNYSGSNDTRCFAEVGYFRTAAGEATKCDSSELLIGALRPHSCSRTNLTVSSLEVRAGYWRPNSSDIEFKLCPEPEYCIPGNGQNCRSGHRGIYCQACEESYSLSLSQGCVICESSRIKSHTTKLVGIGISIFVVSILGIFRAEIFHCLESTVKPSRRKKEKSTFESNSCFNEAYVAIKKFGALARVKLRILFGFYQVITSFRRILHMEAFLHQTDTFTDIINFSSLSVRFDIRCAFEYNHYHKLLIFTLIPLILSALAVGKYFASKRFWPQYGNTNEASRRKEMFTTIFVLGFLIYPGVCQVIFETFQCEYFDTIHEEYHSNDIFKAALRSDYRISCALTSERIGWLIYACLMVLVYPIGICVLYLVNVKRYVNGEKVPQDRRDNKKQEERKARVAFLIYPYKQKFYWFETYELLRKLAQTSLSLGILNYNRRVPGITVNVAQNVCILAIVVLLCLRPYSREIDLYFALISLLLLIPVIQSHSYRDISSCSSSECMAAKISESYIIVSVTELIIFFGFVLADYCLQQRNNSKTASESSDHDIISGSKEDTKELETVQNLYLDLMAENKKHREEVKRLKSASSESAISQMSLELENPKKIALT